MLPEIKDVLKKGHHTLMVTIALLDGVGQGIFYAGFLIELSQSTHLSAFGMNALVCVAFAACVTKIVSSLSAWWILANKKKDDGSLAHRLCTTSGKAAIFLSSGGVFVFAMCAAGLSFQSLLLFIKWFVFISSMVIGFKMAMDYMPRAHDMLGDFKSKVLGYTPEELIEFQMIRPLFSEEDSSRISNSELESQKKTIEQQIKTEIQSENEGNLARPKLLEKILQKFREKISGQIPPMSSAKKFGVLLALAVALFAAFGISYLTYQFAPSAIQVFFGNQAINGLHASGVMALSIVFTAAVGLVLFYLSMVPLVWVVKGGGSRLVDNWKKFLEDSTGPGEKFLKVAALVVGNVVLLGGTMFLHAYSCQSGFLEIGNLLGIHTGIGQHIWADSLFTSTMISSLPFAMTSANDYYIYLWTASGETSEETSHAAARYELDLDSDEEVSVIHVLRNIFQEAFGIGSSAQNIDAMQNLTGSGGAPGMFVAVVGNAFDAVASCHSRAIVYISPEGLTKMIQEIRPSKSL